MSRRKEERRRFSALMILLIIRRSLESGRIGGRKFIQVATNESHFAISAASNRAGLVAEKLTIDSADNSLPPNVGPSP